MKRQRRFSLWVVPAALLLGGGFFAAILLGTIYLRPAPADAKDATAILTVIFAPTSTPQLIVTPAQTTTPTPGGSGATIGGISQGMYVQISGTGGDGLRLRKDASIGAPVNFMGYEAEVFKVTDGPQTSDGYTWWYLTAPYDKARSGWAASNYLAVIELTP